MDDLGLDTESLVEAKRILYDRGVGENLGQWERLPDSQKNSGFRHIFLWRRKDQLLVGRIWASKDGKGRSLYPMTACAHCVGIPVKESLEAVCPCLEELQQECAAVGDADQVRGVIAAALDRLQQGIAGAEIAPSEKVTVEVLSGVLADLFVRCSAFMQGTFSARKEPVAAHYRLPSKAESPANSLMFWQQFLARYVHEDAPVLLFRHHDENCTDLVLGEPLAEHLFALRVGLGGLPLSCEPAARADERLQQRARSMIDLWLNPGSTAETATRQRSWFQFLR
jgi:hypothetical protein